jgi:hypothetical protein
MKNRTEINRQLDRPERAIDEVSQCQCRAWCEVPGPTHDGEHSGEADLPKITATAYREDFAAHDDGIVVPEVVARLVEQTGPSNTLEPISIRLSIIRPDEQHCWCSLTLKEAELLGKALGLLLSEVEADREAGLS